MLQAQRAPWVQLVVSDGMRGFARGPTLPGYSAPSQTISIVHLRCTLFPHCIPITLWRMSHASQLPCSGMASPSAHASVSGSGCRASYIAHAAEETWQRH